MARNCRLYSHGARFVTKDAGEWTVTEESFARAPKRGE